jgi:hypothetical protein
VAADDATPAINLRRYRLHQRLALSQQGRVQKIRDRLLRSIGLGNIYVFELEGVAPVRKAEAVDYEVRRCDPRHCGGIAMSEGYFEFPKPEDWKRIYGKSPFGQIYSLLHGTTPENRVHNALSDFARAMTLDECLLQIEHRVADVSTSYVLMMFYYEKGIPDKRWYISPGRDGASVQYYPDFEDVHFEIKAWFDFYSDTLYYKLFSAWDLVGHELNAKYDLRIDRVDFGLAISGLKAKDAPLYTSLKTIQDSPIYKRANKIRNDITHNYLPYTTGIAFCTDKSGFRTTIGLREYVTSEEIVANIHATIDLFATTLKYILV